jgi:hypothetical protein
MEAALRVLGIVRYALMTSIVIYFFLVMWLPSTASPNPVIFYALTLLAVTLVAVVFVFRRVFVTRSEKALTVQPDDRKALAQWRTGYLVIYCLSESVVLYGVVLHFLGFSASQVAPFYLAGFLLILFFAPRRPSNQLG